MFPWDESENPEFLPLLADELTRRTRRGYRDGNFYDNNDFEIKKSALKSVPPAANYDYLTIDSDLTEDQLLLCSYYVPGYMMKNRKWGLFAHQSQQPSMLIRVRVPQC